MLEEGWLGRRVTVRRALGRDDAGRIHFGDVVGDLVRLDASLAVVDTRTGPVEVPVDAVAVAKLAPPSTADELALETVAAASWRAAETAHIGGWLLRANGGFTNRANSVLPLRAPRLPVEQALAQARAWYHQRGLPLRLMVPSEARRLLDADLGERGWPILHTVLVMAARLDQLRSPGRDRAPVQLEPAPDDAWLARYRDGTAASAVARALLTRHDTVTFAAVREAGECMAIARGTVDDGWLGITATEVAASHRRQGLAGAVLAAVWEWGRAHGAVRSFVQVESRNEAAIALYERLGYWVHHDYRVRVDPDDAEHVAG